MEIFCLGVLRVFWVFLELCGESVGRILPRGGRMDLITKMPTVCRAEGLAVLGDGRQEICGPFLSGAHSPEKQGDLMFPRVPVSNVL